jgi:glycosyltransferase involved in cell wall biosynthesis
VLEIDYAYGADKSRLQLLLRLFSRWPIWAVRFLLADKAIVQETLVLWPVVWIRRTVLRRMTIFDFSDPVDQHDSGSCQLLRKIGFEVMTRYSNFVIVENRSYLPELKSKGVDAFSFWGPVDATRYAAARERRLRRNDDVFRIGWTGSPGTLGFIEGLFPVIDELASERSVELVLIGVKSINYSFRHASVTLKNWDAEAEFEDVATFDLGLFVLERTELGSRRGAGKLFIYLAAGVPFIATDWGIASQVMTETGLGFAVGNSEEWLPKLRHAISNTAERVRFEQEGKAFGERSLSYERFRERLLTFLQ